MPVFIADPTLVTQGERLRSCNCQEGYEGDQCETRTQVKACCECLKAKMRPDDSGSCLAIGVDTCISGVTFASACGCWESCWGECMDVGYPYAEKPNGCMHSN